MDVYELRRERAALEARLEQHIAAELAAFKALTGLSPASISIGMVSINRVGDRESTYCVSSVRANLEI